MPKPFCVQCKTTDTFLWRTAESGQICNDCYIAKTEPQDKVDQSVKSENNGDDKEKEEKDKDKDKEPEKEKEDMMDVETTPAKATGKGTRKSTRATRYKAKTPASSAKAVALRSRGRRSLYKKTPVKAHLATSTVVTSESIFYKGKYMQIGDIVSMRDVEGGVYYAQIRGFLSDEYCEKSAVVTWLLPTQASPPPQAGFDPPTYIIGPEEDLPRKLEYMEFVMHAPSDYYKASDTPYPLSDAQLNDCAGYIWTSIEPADAVSKAS